MRKLALFVASFVLAALVFTTPARAGTGPSNYCFDGTWTDVPLLPGPITVGVEVNTGSPGTWVTVCYATSQVGYSGAHLAGGMVHVFVAPNGTGYVWCPSDTNPETVAVDCLAPFSFSPTTGAVSLTLTGTVDTVLTPAVTVGKTGVAVSPFVFISPGVSAVPRYPCVWVLGVHQVPNCGAIIA